MRLDMATPPNAGGHLEARGSPALGVRNWVGGAAPPRRPAPRPGVFPTETTTESQKGGPATANLGPIKATLLSSARILEGCRQAPVQSGAYRADRVVVSGMAGAAA